MTDKDNISTDPERLRPFRVGEWQVLPEFNELRGRAGPTRVQPRLIQVLRLLAQNAGRTVTREALIDGAWSRRMVNDEVLSRTIADLRQVLGDDARQPRYLETIPKLGYRLIADVEWLQPDAPAQTPAVAPTPVAAADPEPAAHQPAGPLAVSDTLSAVRPRRRMLFGFAGVSVALAIAAAVYWREATGPAPADSALPARVLRAQPLTSDPGWELSPRFAHSGDLIAYSDSVAGQGTATVMLRSRDGRVLRAFTDGSSYDICPTFAPDDSELLWTRHNKDGCEILRAPLLGGAPAPVTDCAPDVLSCPDWSGDWLVYSAPPAADRGAGLTRMRLSDGKQEVLTSPARGDGNDAHPRIAADGRIAFARGVEGDRSLWLWQPASGERRIEFAPGMVYGQDWLPDGRLLTATDALGFRALVAVDATSGAAELLGARGARYPDVAADGALVYEHASYDANLWLQPGDGGEPRQLTQSVRYDAYPRLSPDGSRVLYQTNRDGPESLYLLDLATGTETRLPLDPAMRWAQPAWSADAQQLTLTRYASASGNAPAARETAPVVDLWHYAIGSDAPTRLSSAPPNAHDAQFDPDGEHGWARVGQERVARLLRFRLDGSGAPLTRAEIVEHYQIDRQGLFLVQEGDGRLFHCADPVAPACTALPLALSPAHRRNWAVVDGAVYAVCDSDDDPAVTRHDLASGVQRRLPWPVPGALSRALDVDRSERFAIIARTDRVDVDLHWVAPERAVSGE